MKDLFEQEGRPPFSDTIDRVITKGLSDLNEKLEQLIVDRLKDHGYTFSDKKELYHFAKTRCQLLRFPDPTHPMHGECWLEVDGKTVCYWKDNVTMTQEGNKIIFTMNTEELPTNIKL